MIGTLRRFFYLTAVGLTLLLLVLVVNQTTQLVAAASAISPLLGQIVLYAILSAFVLFILAALFEIMRLPSPLVPVDKDSPGYATFRKKLRARLQSNTNLRGVALETEADLTAAIKALDELADAFIKKTACSVFVTTAVSQNGQLDGLAVLGAQANMIWRIARIYNQRPGLREIGMLYWNVLGTAFATTELDDVAVGEQLEPVVKTALSGSLLGLIPGISGAASLVTQSIFEGTAAAFLTLRVGIICRMYCALQCELEKQSARRNATAAAAMMLGSIAASSATSVVKAMAAAATRAGGATVQSAASGAREIGARLNPFKARPET